MTTSVETLPPAYDPTHAESTWYPVWERAGYFAPNLDAAAAPYCIVIPPPNVTGSLHMGHALTTTLEDVLTRWRRMQGKKTLWLPGTDHAGIATQMVVERELAKTEKKSRHDLGRAQFLERVWQWKATYGDRISRQLRVLGCSLDWSRERFTMDAKLSAAVLEVFVRLHEDGLIYRAERLVNWCPRCHTALSDLEVDHQEGKTGELWSFAYPLADGSGEIVVATTRPETMLGDTAVAVHPDDPRYRAHVGKHVKHPLLGYRIPIIADPVLVDPKFGTGAVKVTPAHDFNDFETGKRHALVLFNIFDVDARITPTPELHLGVNAGVGAKAATAEAMRAEIDLEAWRRFAGLDRMVARKQVKEALQGLGLERKSEPHEMSIGGCQRCETVVEPSLSVQWFVRTAPLARPALEAVKSGATRILPETWTKTYYHWMENIQDWCISRQLWWGHRIPAYYCRDCDKGVGNEDNLRFDSGAKPLVARHKPERCPRCGGANLVQDADVLDTWFSSALWPFSTLGWPEETRELQTFYPVSVMETGFDILFFWVARMMMMGCKFMGRPPFPVIYLHAMVRDKFGDKMSKTRGNVIDPLHLIHGCNAAEVSPQFKDEYPDGFPAFGADALRFTLAAMSASGRDIKLSVERIAGYRAFANKIWNAARFVLMRLPGPPKPVAELESSLHPADRFILSRLHGTVTEVDAALEAYRFSDAATAVYAFIWNELCDWYIELVKPRLAGDDPTAKAAAASVLVHTLDQALRLLHPFMPFITEEIWQKLPIPHAQASIMIALFPTANPAHADPALEAEYRLVQDTIVGLRTIRAESNVSPSKQISARLVVPDPEDQRRLTGHAGEIKSLARLADLTIAGTTDKAEGCAVKVLERLQIVVPLLGLVDFQEEAARLRKAIDKATTERERLEKKLANESFVARAPADVVEKDRARAAELGVMIDKLQTSLRELPQS
ncbi:MAG: valine--tRNA ligase [Deltaproteobacteria bacterium]|nr:valine--tRNA ligase [Deltaproteobacteria bacterium]